MINLKSFLNHVYQEQNVPEVYVICFTCSEYPLLFFSFLFKFLKQYQPNLVEIITITDSNLQNLYLRFATSFLGQKRVYWLHDVTILERKKLKDFLSYASSYNGPHTIVFFLTKNSLRSLSKKICVVDVPNEITCDEMIDLSLLVQSHTICSNNNFFQHVFEYIDRVPLDTACILFYYALLVGKSTTTFFNTWIDRILIPQQSLFLLSQNFFAKNETQFFAQWSRIHKLYAMPFWVVFWSEQLWRATWYTRLTRNRSYVEAKKVSFRLPFSFINRDWRQFHSEELKKAHQFIYDIDVRLKNGGGSFSLELFYTKFFLNKFV